MLLTPFGPVKLFVNDKEIEYEALRFLPDKYCPNVNGRYLIQYNYRKEFGVQKIKCCLPKMDLEGDFDGDERLEAISFYKEFTKLTIGLVAEFGLDEENGYDGYDYSGSYLKNGLEYETNLHTESQTFRFGVSWIRPFTEENDYQTSSGADPSLMPTEVDWRFQISEEEIYMWDSVILAISGEFEKIVPGFNYVGINYHDTPVKIIVTTFVQEKAVLNQKELTSMVKEIFKSHHPDLEKEPFEIVMEEK